MRQGGAEGSQPDTTERAVEKSICTFCERRAAKEKRIAADRPEMAKLVEKGSDFLSSGQVRWIVQFLHGTRAEPLEMLQRLHGKLRKLCKSILQVDSSAITEAT